MRKVLQYLLILFGCGFLLYSPITNYFEEQRVSKLLEEMDQYVDQIDPEDYSEIKDKAIRYNEQLWARYSGESISGDENLLDQYDDVLNLNGYGLMGKIEVPSVDIELPIMHGEEDSVLATASGHHKGSALPIGTENSRAVLSAHTGLATPKLFTRVDELEEGDLFFIQVLDETLAYEVCDIEVILPTEIEKLNPVEGEDLVTLLTCTPYGVNSHRLLVTGRRTFLSEEEIEEAKSAVSTKLSWHELVFYVIPAIVVTLIFLIFLYRILKKRRKKKLNKAKVAFERSLPNIPNENHSSASIYKEAEKNMNRAGKDMSKETDEKVITSNSFGDTGSLPPLPEHSGPGTG